MTDEAEKPPPIIRLVPPTPGFKASGLMTPLLRPELPKQAASDFPQRPPSRPPHRDAIIVDAASGPDAKCRLCGKPVEPGSVQLNYSVSPLIHAKVAFCFRCTAETLLAEADRRYKPIADAEAAADYAEGRQHGFSRDEMRALALQGFGGLPLKPRKMSGEFITAAISLAGKLRRDWGSGAAGGLSHDTLKALEALLEALGEQIDGSRRVR